MECKHNRFKGFILCADCARFKTDQILDKINNLEDENNILKSQLAELHQANVNLFNEGEKLKRNLKGTDAQYNTLMIKQDAEIEQLKEDVKILNQEVAFWKNSFNSCVNLKISAEDTCSNLSIKLNKFQKERASYNKGLDELHQVILNQNKEIKDLKEQLEIKETINQDLAKKYQLLEEEIQAYDINMLELVESYKKLEQDYNDSKERLKIKGEVLSNLTAHTNELEDKYKELQSDYNELSKNMLQGLQVKLQHRVKPYLSAGVVNVIIETKEDFK